MIKFKSTEYNEIYKIKIKERSLLNKTEIYQLLTKELGLEFVKKEEPMSRTYIF